MGIIGTSSGSGKSSLIKAHHQIPVIAIRGTVKLNNVDITPILKIYPECLAYHFGNILEKLRNID